MANPPRKPTKPSPPVPHQRNTPAAIRDRALKAAAKAGRAREPLVAALRQAAALAAQVGAVGADGERLDEGRVFEILRDALADGASIELARDAEVVAAGDEG